MKYILPTMEENLRERDLIVYAKNDVPEIIHEIIKLRVEFKNINEIETARHNDIFLSEDTIQAVKNHLKEFCS